MDNIPLLVRTPPPFRHESLFGFLLRVAEENGYSSPREVARIAGISMIQSQSRTLPVRKLALVLGLDANALNRYSYIPISGKTKDYFKLLDHEFIHRYTEGQIRSNCQFCPLCADENGYIDAFWDLTIALACPKHLIVPLSHCHKCSQKIRWSRPGLLHCQCGANFLEAPLRVADRVMVSLMQIVHAKVHDSSVLKIQNPFLFPLEILEKIPLNQILPMTHTLKRLGHSSSHLGQDSEAKVLKGVGVAACNIFSQWPTGFQGVMRKNRRDFHAPNTDFWLDFKVMYFQLTNNRWLDRSCNFLLDEMIRYGTTLSPKKAKPKKYTPELSTNMHDKSSRYSKNNFLNLMHTYAASETQLISPFTEKNAAQFLGLPLEVMSMLSKVDVFSRFLISGLSKTPDDSWYQDQLDEVIHSVCAHTTQKVDIRVLADKDLITLEDVMSLGRASTKMKAALVANIIWKQFPVYGWKGGNLAALLLERSAVTNYVFKRGPVSRSACLFQSEVMARLYASKELVQALIDLGFLSYLVKNKTEYVISASLRVFEEKFITPAGLSKKLNISLGSLENMFKILQVPTLKLPINGGSAIEEIIDRGFELKIKIHLNHLVSQPSVNGDTCNHDFLNNV